MPSVTPTLAMMDEVYRLDPGGGPRSRRFIRYTELCAARHPLSHYNPMTTKAAAPETVRELLEIDAEMLAGEAIAGEGSDPYPFWITVATPGLWTDRVFTDVRWRLSGQQHIWFWAGEPIDIGVVTARAISAERRSRWARNGPATTLLEYAGQEGVAAGPLRAVTAAEVENVVRLLEQVGRGIDDHLLAAFTFGDEVATEGGWRPLGLIGDEGVAVVGHLAGETGHTGQLADRRWVPLSPGS